MNKNDSISREYENHKQTYQNWQAKRLAQFDEMNLAERKTKLRKLVKTVINNELNDFQKHIVDLHWYNDVSKEEVARQLNLDISTVYRHLERINNLIYEKLKYAIEYNLDMDESEYLKLFNKGKDLCQEPIKCEDLPQRIKALRKANFLDFVALSKVSNISTARLRRLENKLEIFTLDDVQKFCEIFDVSADFLIFGIVKS